MSRLSIGCYPIPNTMPGTIGFDFPSYKTTSRRLSISCDDNSRPVSTTAAVSITTSGWRLSTQRSSFLVVDLLGFIARIVWHMSEKNQTNNNASYHIGQ